MFRTTYLGARSWLIQSGSDALLVDPLFGGRFATRGGTLGFGVYPPRKLDVAELPELSGVVLTSESPMHFDLDSLRRLPHGTLVHVANNISVAATTVLREMGFRVRCCGPGVEVGFGDLRVMFLLPLQAGLGLRAQVDRCALSIRETTGEGHFCQSVNGPSDVTMWRDAWAVVPRPGIWVFDVGANHSWNRTWTTPNPDASSASAREFLAAHEELSDYWGAPRAYVACGPGFAYDGALAALNQTAFPVEPSSLCRALNATLAPSSTVTHLLPGMALQLGAGGELGASRDEALVQLPARAGWPSLLFESREVLVAEFPPFSGSTQLDDQAVDELTTLLTGLAQAFTLLGLARDLLALNLPAGDRRRRAAALILRVGDHGKAALLEYDPQQCRFVESNARAPVDEYPIGLELWAMDLLLTLSGACNAEFLERGHSRAWNSMPTLLRWSMVDMIRMFTQPLMLPSEHLQSYRAQLGEGASHTRD